MKTEDMQLGELELFIRYCPLQLEEWIELIRLRVQQIAPFLPSFDLVELGKGVKLRNGVFDHHIIADQPEFRIGQPQFSLMTRGIFGVQAFKDVEYQPKLRHKCPITGAKFWDGTLSAWGLTEEARWILITVDFVALPGNREHGHEKATVVQCREESLANICAATKVPLVTIWNELGRFTRLWAKGMETRAMRARKLAQMVDVGEALLGLISKPETAGEAKEGA